MKNDVKKVSSFTNKKWCGWIPNTSGSISFYIAGRRENLDMPVTVFSYKIPYHSIKPQQHKHIFQLRSRDKDNQKDQDAKNSVFVLSFVCQERDNFDGSLPLFFLCPILMFLPRKWYKKIEKCIFHLYLWLATFEWHLNTLPFRIRKTEWHLKIPYFRLRKAEWRLKIPYFRLRKIKLRTKIPYVAFYFGNYISPPDEANQKLYEGVQLIKGTVFSILHHPRMKSILEEIIKDMSEMEMRESQINDEQSIDRIDASLGKLQSRIKEFTDNEDKGGVGFSADFELERNGIVNMGNFRCSDSVQKDLKNDPDKKDPPKHYANQLFYFIKDIFHAHSHHSETDDCLSSLHSMPDNSSDLKYKLGCLRRVFQRLMRRYVQMECTSVEKKYLLGFLAYIRSLQVLMDKLGKSLSKKSFKPLNLNGKIVRESAEAAVERGNTKEEQSFTTRRWIYGLLTAYFLLELQMGEKLYFTPISSGIVKTLYPLFLPFLPESYPYPMIIFMLWCLWIAIGWFWVYVNYRQVGDKLGRTWQEWIYWRRASFQGRRKWIYWPLVLIILIIWALFYFWVWTFLSFWVWIPLLMVFVCVLILSLFFYLKPKFKCLVQHREIFTKKYES